MGYRDYSSAKGHIVDSTGHGDFTTIVSAITAASSGQTIFIRPGTYTENPALKAGVNLSAYDSDGLVIGIAGNTGTVVINGKVSMTTAGTSVISGVTFQTNSDYALSVTGSAATNVLLTNCTISGSNHNLIEFTSSSSSANIFIQYSNTYISNATYNLYDMTSPGSLSFYYCSSSQAGTVASNNSAGVLTQEYVNGNTVMTTSGTGIVTMIQSDIDTGNTTTLTTSGTGQTIIRNSALTSGTSSCLSIGSGTTGDVRSSVVSSTNTNAIAGAGTINYSALNFTNTSAKISTTTQTGGLLKGGLTQNPNAGFIGEHIRANATVSITTATAGNVTSISLTAGIWDVSGIANYAFTTSATSTTTGLSITSATFTGSQGDDYVNFINTFSTNAQISVSIPSKRVMVTSTTTFYLVQQATFIGTATCLGRISATRVG
jgi:hypothetical protein